MSSVFEWLSRYRKRIIAFFLLFLALAVGSWFLTPFLLGDMEKLLGTEPVQTMVAEALASRVVLAAAVSAVVTVFAAAFFLIRKPLACLAGLMLFAAGLVFGRMILLPKTILMLTHLIPEGFQMHIGIWNFTAFCVLFELILGIVFEEPVAVWILFRLHLVTGSALRKKRKAVYLVMLILMAFLTPTQDALTLILTMLPLILLYELSAVFLSVLEKRKETGENG